MSVQITVAARRDLAQRAAFDSLVAAGDPVAEAIAAAVRDATTVQMSEQLVDRVRGAYEQTAGPVLSDGTLFDVMVSAFQAAGFEVTT